MPFSDATTDTHTHRRIELDAGHLSERRMRMESEREEDRDCDFPE